jgi:hypothetical protein
MTEGGTEMHLKERTFAILATTVFVTIASTANAAGPNKGGATEPKKAAAVQSDKGPHGWLDAPPAGTVKGKVAVRGWALAENGRVTKIQLLVDGKPLPAKLAHNDPRPDVCKTHANPACPKVGFTGEADFSKVKKGKHTLSLRLTDNANRTIEVGKREITVE